MDRSSAPSVFLPRLDDSKGPAWVLSRVAERALVRAAMGNCGFDGCPSDTERKLSLHHETSRRRVGLPRLGAVVLLVGSSTAAAALAEKYLPSTETRVPGVVAEVACGLGMLTAGAESMAGGAEPAAEAESALGSHLEWQGHDGAELGASANDALRLREKMSASGRANIATPSGGRKQTASESIPSRMPMALPSDALRTANGLRAQRRFDLALAKYLEIVQRHPDSAQAWAASIAAATLRLEYGADPIGARELLLAHPKQEHWVPEALFLLARSYRSSAEAPKERTALLKFVSAHPDHPLAAKAQRRLAVLATLCDHDVAYQARF